MPKQKCKINYSWSHGSFIYVSVIGSGMIPLHRMYLASYTYIAFQDLELTDAARFA